MQYTDVTVVVESRNCAALLLLREDWFTPAFGSSDRACLLLFLARDHETARRAGKARALDHLAGLARIIVGRSVSKGRQSACSNDRHLTTAPTANAHPAGMLAKSSANRHCSILPRQTVPVSRLRRIHCFRDRCNCRRWLQVPLTYCPLFQRLIWLIGWSGNFATGEISERKKGKERKEARQVQFHRICRNRKSTIHGRFNYIPVTCAYNGKLNIIWKNAITHAETPTNIDKRFSNMSKIEALIDY